MKVLHDRPAEPWMLLSAGFRPFFLAAGLWACLSMAVWIAVLAGGVALSTAFDPVAWHFHELMFGFVAAAIAGFLLTAIPNWTGRLPIQGWPLGSLVLLWLLGRVAVALSAWTGPAIAMAIDLLFLIAFAAVVGREIVAGRNWRNVPVLIVLVLLIAANALIHAGAFAHPGWEAIGKRPITSPCRSVVIVIPVLVGRKVSKNSSLTLRKRPCT